MSRSKQTGKGRIHTEIAYYGQGEYTDTSAWSDGDGQIILTNDQAGRVGAASGAMLAATEDFVLALADKIRSSDTES